MTAIKADYRTYKHIPTRSCVQLIIEVPEEAFPNVCAVLGYPITRESKPVGIVLLDESVIEKTLSNSTPLDNPVSKESLPTEKSEGDKLLALSHIRCKDKEFQAFIKQQSGLQNSGIRMKGEYQTAEQWCVTSLRDYCNIKSRSELTTDVAAQEKFRELDQKFKDWQYANQYKDNLDRED